MATATVVKAWARGEHAYLAVVVDEGGALGRIQYLARTDTAGKTLAQIKADLVEELRARRDAQLATVQVLNITGTVEL